MKTITSTATMVWCADTTGLYHPLTEAMSTVGVSSVRVSIELERMTNDLVVQGYWERSFDGVTWDRVASPLLGDALSADGGPDVPSAYATLDQDDLGRYIRFGVYAKNASSSTTSVGYVTIRIDL